MLIVRAHEFRDDLDAERDLHLPQSRGSRCFSWNRASVAADLVVMPTFPVLSPPEIAQTAPLVLPADPVPTGVLRESPSSCPESMRAIALAHAQDEQVSQADVLPDPASGT